MPQGFGFWVRENRIIPLRAPLEDTHISYITQHPEEFHLTREEIQRVYDTYQEELHREGKAREEIIKRVSQEGWIRVRHYLKPDYWSIQTYDTVRERKYIVDFVVWCLQHTIDNKPIMTLHDELRLFSYKDESSIETYDYARGGVRRFLEEHGIKEIKVQ